jgi:Ca2+/Na+ antiporter
MALNAPDVMRGLPMRNLFKGMEGTNFKKIDGGYLYWPWSIYGSVYIVTEKQKAEIEQLTRRFLVIVGALLVVGVVADLYFKIAALAGLLAALVYYFFKTRSLTADLPRSKERPTTRDTTRAFAATQSLTLLYIMLAFTGILALGFALAAVVAISPFAWKQFSIGIGGTLLFGFCFSVFIRLVLAKEGDPDFR